MSESRGVKENDRIYKTLNVRIYKCWFTRGIIHRVVGAFADGNSTLMLVCARLRHVAGKDWGCKRYLCMKYLDETAE